VVPLAIEELFALTVIDCSVAAVTVSAEIFDVIPFWLAVMLVDPIAVPVARPVALMSATVGLELAQITAFVRSCVLPSPNVPVALYCTVVPLAIEEFVVLIVIDCNVAAVTVSDTEFDVIPPCVAVMVADPPPTPFAKPLPLTIATDVFEEFQLTELVRFCVEPSLNVPIAVN